MGIAPNTILKQSFIPSLLGVNAVGTNSTLPAVKSTSTKTLSQDLHPFRVSPTTWYHIGTLVLVIGLGIDISFKKVGGDQVYL